MITDQTGLHSVLLPLLIVQVSFLILPFFLTMTKMLPNILKTPIICYRLFVFFNESILKSLGQKLINENEKMQGLKKSFGLVGKQ